MKRGRGWEEGVVAATAAPAAAAPAIPTAPAPASFDSLVPVSSVSRSLVRAHPHPLGCADSHAAMFIPAHPRLSPHHAHLAAAWPLCSFDCTFVRADRLCPLVLGLRLGSFGLVWAMVGLPACSPASRLCLYRIHS